MNRSVVSFNESIQLKMGLLCAGGIMLASFFSLSGQKFAGFGAAGIGYSVAALVALWALRSLGVTCTVTATSIKRVTPFSECKMLWSEIEYIEIGPSCFWLMFHGDGKRLWMKAPRSTVEAWLNQSDDEDENMTVLLAEAEARNIPMTSGLWTMFKTSRC